jgi:hypothetical protein
MKRVTWALWVLAAMVWTVPAHALPSGQEVFRRVVGAHAGMRDYTVDQHPAGVNKN